MTRHCLDCHDEIDEFENSVYCKNCRCYSVTSGNRNTFEYNYIWDHNPRDEWDDQAVYSKYYDDQYSW